MTIPSPTEAVTNNASPTVTTKTVRNVEASAAWRGIAVTLCSLCFAANLRPRDSGPGCILSG